MTSGITEPTFEAACQWWPDTPNIWTPLGWKDHLFRFNVLWNGTILADPTGQRNHRAQRWRGQGVQIALAPHHSERFREIGTMSAFLRHDDGMVRQGWHDTAAPLLWSEFSRDGVMLRSDTFAHIPGGGDVQTGIEPMFLWMRLSISETCDVLPLEDVYGFQLLIYAPHISASMQQRENPRFNDKNSRYPRRLAPVPQRYSRARGQRMIERGENVRLGVAPSKDCLRTAFSRPTRGWSFYLLYIEMPTRRGAHVDVLVPMLPTQRKVFNAEMKVGYDTALRQANRYWSRITRNTCRFEVPEDAINQAIRHSVRFSHVLTEKNPKTGQYCKISGSLGYTNLWSTPAAMDMAMMMDTLGHHRMVERYLDIFRREQGTVVPPGDAYTLHPGYLSTPAEYKSYDWLSDNGALLYTLCTHALLSGDRKFIARYTDAIVKSCQFLRDARAIKGHRGAPGVLPPGETTDRTTMIQAVWAVGWNYKGLCAAVRLLKRIGHERAGEFEAEAAEFRAAFLAAFRRKSRGMPRWSDARGRRRVFVPTSLTEDEKSESRDPFYLDTGPLFLVFAGLLDADDPLMRDARDWFRHGPQWKLYRSDTNCFQVPVLEHEISSCEPCYSWNIFHSHQLGDRHRFLEGMYSLFAGGMSRQTQVSVETRGGIGGCVFTAPLAINLARLAVIDDQVHENELHLLRLIPLAWVGPGDTCRFDDVPTEFGPATLRTRRSRNGKTLHIIWRPRFRHAPGKVVLHIPPAPGLGQIKVNSKTRRPRAGKMLL